ncbi:MAG: type II toxin-antitoxin system HicB family antitoxin [Deltaproteobacteria bacterium]|nr:type II toxin-antitoxin system HicB family antitoxin [Deltaproteobacteria bacterium]
MVIVHPDLEDGGYWVECPELPGCASQGDTVEEALEMIRDAIEGHRLPQKSRNPRRPGRHRWRAFIASGRAWTHISGLHMPILSYVFSRVMRNY